MDYELLTTNKDKEKHVEVEAEKPPLATNHVHRKLKPTTYTPALEKNVTNHHHQAKKQEVPSWKWVSNLKSQVSSPSLTCSR